MTSYQLAPEVAGGLGPATVFDQSAVPWRITRLEYRFDDWLGDDLVTSTPAVLATVRVRDAIRDAGLTGVQFAPVTVTRSELFDDLGGGDLPEWVWLLPVGRTDVDDFWSADRRDLVVSERALVLLQRFNLVHCDVTPAASGQPCSDCPAAS